MAEEEQVDSLKEALKLRTRLTKLNAAHERARGLVDGKYDAKRDELLSGASEKVLQHLVADGSLPAGYLS